jgi:hypothetical protein
MPPPVVTQPELATFLKRAGLVLTPQQLGEYCEAYGYVQEMAARLRTERSHMAEPAHVFGFPTQDEQ